MLGGKKGRLSLWRRLQHLQNVAALPSACSQGWSPSPYRTSAVLCTLPTALSSPTLSLANPHHPHTQPALESIAFQNVGCSVHGCAAVDELMRNTQHLRRLHLYNNMSGDEGAASIAR